MGIDGYEVEEVALDEVLPIRTAQFRPLLAGIKPFRREADDAADTHHFGVRSDEDGELVAVATYYRECCPELEEADHAGVRLFGFVVREPWRGRGLGARLYDEATATMCGRYPAIDHLWGNAEVQAIGFWRRVGCEPIGEAFEQRGELHVLTLGPLRADSLEDSDLPVEPTQLEGGG